MTANVELLRAENKRLANALQSLLRYVERCREAGVLVCDDIGPEEFARYELEQALSLPPEQPAAAEVRALELLAQQWEARSPPVAQELRSGRLTMGDRVALRAIVAALSQQQPAARPPKPTECMNGCPDRQVCDHCQWPPGPDQQPAAVDEARGVVDVYTMQTIADAAAALDKRGDRQMAARLIRLHTRLLATQHQEPKS